MRVVRNILCLLIIGLFLSCSGDVTKSRSDNTSTILYNEATEDGKIKIAKLEGSEVVVSNATADQQNPHVIYLPDKNLYFSIYEDWSSLTTGADIKGKFVKSDGSICGSEITISNASGNQTVPRAAYRNGVGLTDTTDRIMVVWQDTRSTTNVSGFIYYRTIDVSSYASNETTCSSPTLGTETAITLEDDNLLTGGTQSYATSRTVPKIAYDPVRDKFWIAWVESRTTRKTVSYIPFSFSGNSSVVSWIHGDTQFAGYAVLNGDMTGYDISPTIIEQVNEGGTEYTRGRRIERSVEAYKETRGYEYFDQVFNVAVACDTTTAECLLVWEGQRRKITITNTCTDDSGEATSNKICDSNDIVTSAASDAADPTTGIKAIYGLPDKNFDLRIIPFLRVNSIYVSNSSAATYYPSIGFDPIAKKFLVAWEDLRGGSNTKIYGQLVYSGGGLYNQNILISYQDTDGDSSQDTNIANSKQTRPFVSYDSVNQRYFVIWQDGRNGSVSLENLDIYGQYVDAEGTLRGSNFTISTASANQYTPVIAYNSQNNQFLAVWKDARNYSSTASDIYGQRFSLGQPQLTLLNLDDTSFSPPFLDFNSVITNQFSTKSFKAKNTGDIKLKIDCLTSLTSPFSHELLPTELQTCEGTYAASTYFELVPNAELPFTVRFQPTSQGAFISSFTIQSDGENKTVNLQGTSVQPSITVSTTTLAFGNVSVGQSSDLPLTITNNGTKSYNITNISGVSAPFSIVTLPTYPYTLDAGQSLSLTVRFTPTQVGGSSGTMNIQTNLSGVSATVALSGTGTGTPALSVSPTSLDFGSVTINTTSDKTVTLSNTGTATLTVTSLSITGTGFSLVSPPSTPLSIAAGGSQTITVRFSPTIETSYSGTLSVQSDGGNTNISLVGQGTTTSGTGTGGTGTGGSISSSGGGCSIGGHQNAPSAIANMLIMLTPLWMIVLRKWKSK